MALYCTAINTDFNLAAVTHVLQPKIAIHKYIRL